MNVGDTGTRRPTPPSSAPFPATVTCSKALRVGAVCHTAADTCNSRLPRNEGMVLGPKGPYIFQKWPVISVGVTSEAQLLSETVHTCNTGKCPTSSALPPSVKWVSVHPPLYVYFFIKMWAEASTLRPVPRAGTHSLMQSPPRPQLLSAPYFEAQ